MILRGTKTEVSSVFFFLFSFFQRSRNRDELGELNRTNLCLFFLGLGSSSEQFTKSIDLMALLQTIALTK